jgi:hypothetical protein
MAVISHAQQHTNMATATNSATTPTPNTAVPYRQIRAHYTPKTITVYQAYNAEIASAAVAEQRLDASPLFKPGRMTWIKPSWAWMLYRAGYSYKDVNQARILALTMSHDRFLQVLERGVLSTHVQHSPISGNDSGGTTKRSRGKNSKGGNGADREKTTDVRIQWDPERNVRLERLEYRSIQIGIPGELRTVWVNEWIVGIEDVTEKARELKRVLDESPDITDRELEEMGLIPEERPFEIPKDLQTSLGMV